MWLTPLCPAGHLPLKGGDRQGACSEYSFPHRRSQRAYWRGNERPQRLISPLEGEMSGRTEGGEPPATPSNVGFPTLHNPKPMALIQRRRLHQTMPILIAHMCNIDHRQRIGRLDGENIPRLQRCKFLAASQNRKGAFKPPQIIDDIACCGHSLAQNFQNGFFSGASGAGAAE